MANEGYHEPVAELSDETRDMHRAIISLMEELEAVDWYNQRVDACKDQELRKILAHNRDEEKEHAAMVLEWIRRRDPSFSKELRSSCSRPERSAITTTETDKPQPRESIMLSLVLNIAIPAVILMKLSGENALGPVWGLVVALVFPLGYGLADFARRREWNIVSILGFVSVLLTG